jgi:hypothetical protein
MLLIAKVITHLAVGVGMVSMVVVTTAFGDKT